MPNERHLLIDGPNAIHASRDLDSLARRDRDAARRRLSELAWTIRDQGGWRVTVVFDGRGETLTSEYAAGDEGCWVIYTPNGVTADDVIERLVGRSENPERCRVVSADRAVQSTVAAAGAEVMPPADFFSWVARAEEQLSRRRLAQNGKEAAKWRA